MHPALRKGLLFYKKTPPPISFPAYRPGTVSIEMFLTRQKSQYRKSPLQHRNDCISPPTTVPVTERETE